MSEPKILPKPPGDWMRRLRPDNWVWLAKENELAQIHYHWVPPQPGLVAGTIELFRSNGRRFQRWFVHGDGSGFDGTQLIMPVEGYLSDEPVLLSEMEEVHLQLNHLHREVKALTFTVEGLKCVVEVLLALLTS